MGSKRRRDWLSVVILVLGLTSLLGTVRADCGQWAAQLADMLEPHEACNVEMMRLYEVAYIPPDARCELDETGVCREPVQENVMEPVEEDRCEAAALLWLEFSHEDLCNAEQFRQNALQLAHDIRCGLVDGRCCELDHRGACRIPRRLEPLNPTKEDYVNAMRSLLRPGCNTQKKRVCEDTVQAAMDQDNQQTMYERLGITEDDIRQTENRFNTSPDFNWCGFERQHQRVGVWDDLGSNTCLFAPLLRDGDPFKFEATPIYLRSPGQIHLKTRNDFDVFFRNHPRARVIPDHDVRYKDDSELKLPAVVSMARKSMHGFMHSVDYDDVEAEYDAGAFKSIAYQRSSRRAWSGTQAFSTLCSRTLNAESLDEYSMCKIFTRYPDTPEKLFDAVEYEGKPSTAVIESRNEWSMLYFSRYKSLRLAKIKNWFVDRVPDLAAMRSVDGDDLTADNIPVQGLDKAEQMHWVELYDSDYSQLKRFGVTKRRDPIGPRISQGANAPVSMFIEMDYYKGGDLHGYIAQGTFAAFELKPRVIHAAKILRDMLTGLRAFEIASRSHLDIKPDNVFLDNTLIDGGRVVLGDFGQSLPYKPDGNAVIGVEVKGTRTQKAAPIRVDADLMISFNSIRWAAPEVRKAVTKSYMDDEEMHDTHRETCRGAMDSDGLVAQKAACAQNPRCTWKSNQCVYDENRYHWKQRGGDVPIKKNDIYATGAVFVQMLAAVNEDDASLNGDGWSTGGWEEGVFERDQSPIVELVDRLKDDAVWEDFDQKDQVFELIDGMLKWDPAERMSVIEAYKKSGDLLTLLAPDEGPVVEEEIAVAVDLIRGSFDSMRYGFQSAGILYKFFEWENSDSVLSSPSTYWARHNYISRVKGCMEAMSGNHHGSATYADVFGWEMGCAIRAASYIGYLQKWTTEAKKDYFNEYVEPLVLFRMNNGRWPRLGDGPIFATFQDADKDRLQQQWRAFDSRDCPTDIASVAAQLDYDSYARPVAHGLRDYVMTIIVPTLKSLPQRTHGLISNGKNMMSRVAPGALVGHGTKGIHLDNGEFERAVHSDICKDLVLRFAEGATVDINDDNGVTHMLSDIADSESPPDSISISTSVGLDDLDSLTDAVKKLDELGVFISFAFGNTGRPLEYIATCDEADCKQERFARDCQPSSTDDGLFFWQMADHFQKNGLADASWFLAVNYQSGLQGPFRCSNVPGNLLNLAWDAETNTHAIMPPQEENGKLIARHTLASIADTVVIEANKDNLNIDTGTSWSAPQLSGMFLAVLSYVRKARENANAFASKCKWRGEQSDVGDGVPNMEEDTIMERGNSLKLTVLERKLTLEAIRNTVMNEEKNSAVGGLPVLGNPGTYGLGLVNVGDAMAEARKKMCSIIVGKNVPQQNRNALCDAVLGGLVDGDGCGEFGVPLEEAVPKDEEVVMDEEAMKNAEEEVEDKEMHAKDEVAEFEEAVSKSGKEVVVPKSSLRRHSDKERKL